MKNIEIIRQRINDSIKAKEMILRDDSLLNAISRLANEIVDCLQKGGKLVICGNGGSASDALHFASEIVGRFERERRSWPAIVLNTNVSTMTAIANDYGYDDIFARQIDGLLKNEDLFICISTSGNSENVYRALLRSKEIGARTACLTGYDGGKVGKTADISIVIPSYVTARIQECHINIIHILCEIVETKLSKSEAS